jgi:hypothetical protein
MGFLNNDNDIIIDCVLTDAGRRRLAMGQFKVAKFAVCDDEIDYGLYNKNDSRGSDYYDLQILSTPILEAFTNNTSSMKSKLITINRNNLLYLPILKLNTLSGNKGQLYSALGTFVITADKDTEDSVVAANGPSAGVIFGSGQNKEVKNLIRIDQGLDSNGSPPPETPIDADLIETQYIVYIDNRLGKIVDANGTAASISFIDDDDVATYYLSTANSNFVSRITNTDTNGADSILTGPRGTKLEFKVESSVNLKASDYYFNLLGGTTTTVDTVTVKYIDTIVRVVGATTGYALDIPVRIVKE